MCDTGSIFVGDADKWEKLIRRIRIALHLDLSGTQDVGHVLDEIETELKAVFTRTDQMRKELDAKVAAVCGIIEEEKFNISQLKAELVEKDA
jgi:hypothetical protein